MGTDGQTASLLHAGPCRAQVDARGYPTCFAYDLAGRLAEKVTVKDADTSELVRFAYTRDAGGNPVADPPARRESRPPVHPPCLRALLQRGSVADRSY